jgi:sulfatase modifying factor 1
MTDQPEACCTPSHPGGGRRDEARAVPEAGSAGGGSTEGMVLLPGGRFLMGTEDSDGFPADGEGPVRQVELRAFYVDVCAVSNERFAAFAQATGYVTDAERYGWAFVFAGLLPDDFPQTRGVAAAPWWRQVEGADWRRPFGPQSSLAGLGDHPVVHVSWNDASAYCGWAGKRLPTEAEWEYAARGGLEGKRFPWGDELTPGGQHMMNVWQGTFPSRNTLEDGYLGTAPVAAFPPNGYGLHNVSGNVWEWCSDWFSPGFHVSGSRGNPAGPPSGRAKVIRGGSYLCHASYCNRYRVAARSSNSPDSSSGNTGFRCARDA